MEDVGFRDIEVRDISKHIAPSIFRLERICRYAAPAANALNRLGLISSIHAKNPRAILQMAETLRYGAWQYALIYAKK